MPQAEVSGCQTLDLQSDGGSQAQKEDAGWQAEDLWPGHCILAARDRGCRGFEAQTHDAGCRTDFWQSRQGILAARERICGPDRGFWLPDRESVAQTEDSGFYPEAQGKKIREPPLNDGPSRSLRTP